MSLHQDIQKVYIAYFNRPADGNGLAFWAAQITNGGATLADIMQAFVQSAEYQETFGGKSAADTVSAVYQNLFGRSVEPEGLAYWSNALATGTANIGQFAFQVLDAAAGSDRAMIENKVAAAELLTDGISVDSLESVYSTSEGLALARAWLATIGSEPGSVEAAKSSLADLIVDLTAELPAAREIAMHLGWDGNYVPGFINKEAVTDFIADHDKIRIFVNTSSVDGWDYQFIDSGTVYYRDLTGYGDFSQGELEMAVHNVKGDRGDGHALMAGEAVVYSVLSGGTKKTFLFLDDHGDIGTGSGMDNGVGSAVWHLDSDLWVDLTGIVGLKIHANGYMIENDLFA